MADLAVDLSIDLKQKFTDGFLDRNKSPCAGPDGVAPTFVSSDESILKVEPVDGDPLSFWVVPGDMAGQSAEVHAVVGGDIPDAILTVNLTAGGPREQVLTPGETAPKA